MMKYISKLLLCLILLLLVSCGTSDSSTRLPGQSGGEISNIPSNSTSWLY